MYEQLCRWSYVSQWLHYTISLYPMTCWYVSKTTVVSLNCLKEGCKRDQWGKLWKLVSTGDACGDVCAANVAICSAWHCGWSTLDKEQALHSNQETSRQASSLCSVALNSPSYAMPRFQQILAPHLHWVTLRTEGRFNSNTSFNRSYKRPFIWWHKLQVCNRQIMSTCRKIMRCRKCSIQIVQELFSQRLHVLIMTIVCYKYFSPYTLHLRQHTLIFFLYTSSVQHQ